MKNLLNKSLEIAVNALEGQNDRDLQFTRSLDLAKFIMEIQDKQTEEGVQIIEKEVDSKETLEALKQARQRINSLEAELAKARIAAPVDHLNKTIEELKLKLANTEAEAASAYETSCMYQKELEALRTEFVGMEAEADFYKSEFNALRREFAQSKAPAQEEVVVLTEQEAAAAEVNAIKNEEVPLPTVEPKKESPRPVVRLGAYLMSEANMYGYVYEAFIGDNKVFEHSATKAIPATSDKTDANYAHYVAAAQAVKHASQKGFDKVKLVSTVNLRPDQMTTATGMKYAGIVSTEGVEVFSKVNSDNAYNEKAERKVLNQVLGSASEEVAPF